MAAIVTAAQAGAAVGTALAGPAGTIVGMVVGGTIGVGLSAALYIAYKFRSKANDARNEAIQKKDPALFQESIERLSEEYMLSLSELDLASKIDKKSEKIDVVFFGQTSAGKTSLINRLFELKLEKGIGQTTNITSMVFQDNTKRVWDSVGQNDQFQFFSLENVVFFNVVDIIFIVYRDTVKKIKHMVKLIAGPRNVKYKVYFVRSQCDQWDTDHKKSIDEEIMADYEVLKSYGVEDPTILKSSAKVLESINFKNENHSILQIIQKNSK